VDRRQGSVGQRCRTARAFRCLAARREQPGRMSATIQQRRWLIKGTLFGPTGWTSGHRYRAALKAMTKCDGRSITGKTQRFLAENFPRGQALPGRHVVCPPEDAQSVHSRSRWPPHLGGRSLPTRPGCIPNGRSDSRPCHTEVMGRHGTGWTSRRDRLQRRARAARKLSNAMRSAAHRRQRPRRVRRGLRAAYITGGRDQIPVRFHNAGIR
jgi:hypothetical protein